MGTNPVADLYVALSYAASITVVAEWKWTHLHWLSEVEMFELIMDTVYVSWRLFECMWTSQISYDAGFAEKHYRTTSIQPPQRGCQSAVWGT